MPFCWTFICRLRLHILLLLPFVIGGSCASVQLPSSISSAVSSASFASSSPTSQFGSAVSDLSSGDSHRGVLFRDGERFFVPRRIPKLSRTEKRTLLAQQFKREGTEPPMKFLKTDWTKERKRKGKKRRATSNSDKRPWAVQYVVRRKAKPRTNVRLQARNAGQCPNKLDAVTEAFNRHLYFFAGEMVYEVWRDIQGLQQRRALALSEVFPDGPRRVSAAFTNRKSGVTVLLEYRTVFRFRWDKRFKRFYMARHSPRQLPSQIDFVPKMGFQWKDGHLILSNNKNFVSFDPFWNLVTFSSDRANEYFPNVDKRVIGVAKQGKDAYLMITEDGKLQVYDMQKHKVSLEFPLSVNHFLACLLSASPNSTLAN